MPTGPVLSPTSAATRAAIYAFARRNAELDTVYGEMRELVAWTRRARAVLEAAPPEPTNDAGTEALAVLNRWAGDLRERAQSLARSLARYSGALEHGRGVDFSATGRPSEFRSRAFAFTVRWLCDAGGLPRPTQSELDREAGPTFFPEGPAGRRRRWETARRATLELTFDSTAVPTTPPDVAPAEPETAVADKAILLPEARWLVAMVHKVRETPDERVEPSMLLERIVLDHQKRTAPTENSAD